MNFMAARASAPATQENARSRFRSWRKWYETNWNYQYGSNVSAPGIRRNSLRASGPERGFEETRTTGQAGAETPGKTGQSTEAGTPAKTATAATSAAASELDIPAS